MPEHPCSQGLRSRTSERRAAAPLPSAVTRNLPSDAVTVARNPGLTAATTAGVTVTVGRSGDNARPTTSSSAVRYDAQAAGHAAELIEFPALRRVAEVTREPVTRAPSPDILADNSRPKVAPSLVARRCGRLPVAHTVAYRVAGGLAGIAAWFSLKGLAVLFRGAPDEIILMGAIMECGTLVGSGALITASPAIRTIRTPRTTHGT